VAIPCNDLGVPWDLQNQAGFAERLLEVIDSGRRTATYKLALLLALIDLCAKQTNASGSAPSVLFTRDIAEQVVALYWPQVAPFTVPGGPAVLLKQISLARSKIVDEVAGFRRRAEAEGLTSLHVARMFNPAGYELIIDRVEEAVAEQPIPRLQTVGNSETAFPFLYDIDWRVRQKLSVRRLKTLGGPRGAPLRLREGVGDELVRLSPLLRPLIELHWVRKVASLNDVARVEVCLHDHLFGKDRLPLPKALREVLEELQGGRCFYCPEEIGRADADHFLPRVRCGIDAIENLILADKVCNNDKRDLLASPSLVRRWTERNRTHYDLLRESAIQSGWETDFSGTVSVARAIYGHLPPGDRPFWGGRGTIVLADAGDALLILQAD
jgi:hypothetical protein